MKATGIVRRVDDMGRIVLPVELRRTLEIEDGTPMEIFVDEDKIVLRVNRPVCIFCGSNQQVSDFKGRCVCAACREELAR